MEKIKVCSLVHPPLWYYEWQLTREEKKTIRNILKGIKVDGKPIREESIKSFIHYLQGLCGLKKKLLDQPKRSEVRATRERILTDCKAALGHLKQCERGRVVTWYDETLDSWWRHQPEQRKICPECKHPFTTSSQREKCLQCDPTPPKSPPQGEIDYLVQGLESAWAAVGPLEKFIKVVQEYHKAEDRKSGRRKADNDHFVRKIREIYSEHIGKPTVYPEGPFCQVVRTVLEMFGLPAEDPSRVVRDALKNRA
jgi:hypothetical protein